MTTKQFWHATRLVVLIAIMGAVAVPGFLVQAQPPVTPEDYLTWDDAPITTPLRHEGDAQVRWGWETAEKALGPFNQEPFEVGDRTTFNISSDLDDYEFELHHRSQHAYFWFEVGTHVDPDVLETTAARFDSEIWQLNRYLYGENPTPGIDGDRLIHIVHLESPWPGLAGYFSPDDQCARYICDESNERDAIYLMLDYGPVGSDRYFSTLTHEFQHMIQFEVDGNEYRWLNEGFSQLAEHLAGFRDDPINNSNIQSYLSQPDLYLNSWTYDGYQQGAYYGAGYLMAMYLYERFGVGFIRTLARHPLDGLASIHAVLNVTEQGIGIDELMTDWWIANIVDDPYVADGRYYYQTFDLPESVYTERLLLDDSRMQAKGFLKQYGVRYFEITESGTYQLSFAGNELTSLTPLAPHSAEWVWWSNNASSSVTSMTRTVDLSDVDQARFHYWLYGETGHFPGYLHLLVSTDGRHWRFLESDTMLRFDQYSEAPGPHYSGLINTWRNDSVDLSDYAGQVIQIRIEYVTNNAVTGPGFVLDDMRIPEIGWSDSVEDGATGWEVDGFLRTPQMVQQNWALAVVNRGKTPLVQKIDVQDGGASAEITVGSEGAIIVLGAMAPFTQTEAGYNLLLSPLD